LRAPTYIVASSVLILIQAVNRFVLLADESPEVPKLAKKFYSDFRLSRADWEKIEKMHEVLQVWFA